MFMVAAARMKGVHVLALLLSYESAPLAYSIPFKRKNAEVEMNTVAPFLFEQCYTYRSSCDEYVGTGVVTQRRCSNVNAYCMMVHDVDDALMVG